MALLKKVLENFWLYIYIYLTIFFEFFSEQDKIIIYLMTQMNSFKILEIEPNKKIRFEFIPNNKSVSYISIRNISASNVAFKVKTTNPKSYYVNPVHGFLPPGCNEKIRVEMHPLPTTPLIIKHKFLMEYSILDSIPSTNEEIIKFWETTNKSKWRKSSKIAVEIQETGNLDKKTSWKTAINEESDDDDMDILKYNENKIGDLRNFIKVLIFLIVFYMVLTR